MDTRIRRELGYAKHHILCSYFFFYGAQVGLALNILFRFQPPREITNAICISTNSEIFFPQRKTLNVEFNRKWFEHLIIYHSSYFIRKILLFQNQGHNI